MDLLFENEMYEEVLTVMDFVVLNRVSKNLYPSDATTLSLAACYKLVCITFICGVDRGLYRSLRSLRCQGLCICEAGWTLFFVFS